MPQFKLNQPKSKQNYFSIINKIKRIENIMNHIKEEQEQQKIDLQKLFKTSQQLSQNFQKKIRHFHNIKYQLENSTRSSSIPKQKFQFKNQIKNSLEDIQSLNPLSQIQVNIPKQDRMRSQSLTNQFSQNLNKYDNRKKNTKAVLLKDTDDFKQNNLNNRNKAKDQPNRLNHLQQYMNIAIDDLRIKQNSKKIKQSNIRCTTERVQKEKRQSNSKIRSITRYKQNRKQLVKKEQIKDKVFALLLTLLIVIFIIYLI